MVTRDSGPLHVLGQTNSQGQTMLSSGTCLHGVYGITHEIDQNLQHLVPIHHHLG